ELGQIYCKEVKDILYRLSDVTQKLMAQKNEKHLAISVPQTFGIQWLVPRLSQFNALYPDIEVRLTGVDQDEGLLNREIDIAIYYGRGAWENLQVEKLAEENLLLLASPKLLAKQPVRCAEDLKKHTLIHIHTRDNWQKMADYLQLEELDIQHGPIFSHTFMALQAAVHGQGIVLANRVLAQQEIDNERLQIVLSTQLKDPKSFYVVNQFDKANEEQILAFRQWIINEIRNTNE
ncbi:transcriptional regulator, partial [Avibacterium paragallinarum]